MSREFFAREWLKQRPITYLWTHMIIMPLIDFYATACDWLPAGGSPPHGLFWFVIVSFFNGVVCVGIRRKIRAPEKEEAGQPPRRSVLWGGPKASRSVVDHHGDNRLARVPYLPAANSLSGEQVAITLLTTIVIATILVISFSRTRAVRYGRWFRKRSGIWTILLYLTLGAIPLLAKLRTEWIIANEFTAPTNLYHAPR